jgi:HSP20 family protein
MFNNQLNKISLSSADQEDKFDFGYLANPELLHIPEGQLAIDVGQTDTEVVVIAAMAGTRPEDIELHLHNDLLTIRGQRLSPLTPTDEHFYQECYWGKFSRSVVLPVNVKSELAQAQYSHGVLIIRLPKASPGNDIPIMVVEE